MRLADILRDTLCYVRQRPVKVLLNLVGIGAGAMAITLVLALGGGLRSFIRHQVETIADKTIVQVFPVPEPPLMFAASTIIGRLGKPPKKINPKRRMNPGSFNLRFFTEAEVKALALPYIRRVIPGMLVFAESIRLVGSKDEYEVISIPEGEGFRMEIGWGRGFEGGEDNEVVLASGYADAWHMKPEDLVGKEVILKVRRIPLVRRTFWERLRQRLLGEGQQIREFRAKVVGVTKPSLLSMACFVSLPLALKMTRHLLGDPTLHTAGRWGLVAICRLRSYDDLPRFRKWLKKRGFSCISVDDRLGFMFAILSVVEVGLMVFGVVALLVAGIGVANTMVASVYERRREIGVMKALGARNRTVLVLFSFEALLVGALGGVCGWAVARILAIFGDAILAGYILTGWRGVEVFSFGWWLLPLCVLFCAGCAFVAGLYPAFKAARLDPITCLREE